MNEKEIAKKILESAGEAKDDIISLRVDVQNLFEKYLRIAKNVSGDVPDEKTFLKIVASILDEIVVFKNPIAEAIDGKVFLFIVDKVDKFLLDKFLGENWYSKIVEKIKNA